MKQKILVVEDDVHIRNNVVEFLILNDYEVVSASNGVEGLIYYENFKPDLIICDIMMPEMDGYTFLEELQRRFPFNFTIFIFLTAKNSLADQRKGMHLGADDYIIKPFAFSDLKATIDKKFEKNELRKKSIESALEKAKAQTHPTPYHEFNTCLSGILAGSQLLLENAESNQFNLETKTVIDIIQKSGLRLSRAINNFILNIELSSKNYHPFIEEIPASFIVNTISQVAAQYNRSKDLLLTVEGASMQTDKFLLKRVLEELTDNAFKFTHIGDAVNWDIFLLPRGAKLDLEYPNLCDFTAEKFNNVAPSNQFIKGNQVIEGLGLGLFLSQKIMKMLGADFNYVETNSNILRYQLGYRYSNATSNSEKHGK